MPSPQISRYAASLLMFAGVALASASSPSHADSFAAAAPTTDSSLQARVEALEKSLRTAPTTAPDHSEPTHAASVQLSPAQLVEVERRLESTFIRLGTVNSQELVKVQGGPPNLMSKDELEKERASLRTRIEQEVIAGMSPPAPAKPAAAVSPQMPGSLNLPQPPENSLAPAPLPAISPAAKKSNAK